MCDRSVTRATCDRSVISVVDACVKCGGSVYVPRNESVTTEYCPACRSDLIDRTGYDPEWTRGPGSA